jgi:nicotinate-nucleotide adenylyltransferase
MRLGIFGGSFDPVHTGHLILAEQCREQARLDQVWFVPSATAPHKPDGAAATPRQRREMVELAVAGHESFRVSTLETDRGGTSFTVDTLRAIRAGQPAAELFLLIGSDSLAEFDSWREPGSICQLATPLVFCRPGSAAALELLAPWCAPDRMAAIRAHAIEPLPLAISSSLIRERVHGGRSIRYLVPRAVELYIRNAGLYAASANQA